MAEFKFFHPMEVRYGDLDPQGHLNNAKYLTYFEQARIHYFAALGLFSKDQSFMDIGVIIADIHIQYEAPVFLGAPIKVGVRMVKIGNKSITLEQTVVDEASSQLYAAGTVTLVAYDYHSHKTIPVSEEWRRKLTEFEGIRQYDARKIETDYLMNFLVELLRARVAASRPETTKPCSSGRAVWLEDADCC